MSIGYRKPTTEYINKPSIRTKYTTSIILAGLGNYNEIGYSYELGQTTHTYRTKNLGEYIVLLKESTTNNKTEIKSVIQVEKDDFQGRKNAKTLLRKLAKEEAIKIARDHKLPFYIFGSYTEAANSSDRLAKNKKLHLLQFKINEPEEI